MTSPVEALRRAGSSTDDMLRATVGGLLPIRVADPVERLADRVTNGVWAAGRAG